MDTDILKKLISETDGQNFEDILPYLLEHEVREAYTTTRKIRATPDEERCLVEGNSGHDSSAYHAMKRALQDGKLDKYVEFLEAIQYVAREQCLEFYGGFLPLSVRTQEFIERDRRIAEKVKRENS